MRVGRGKTAFGCAADAVPSASARGCWAAISVSGTTSASISVMLDLVRSWLRSRRTVSRLASTSSAPPAMNPATSTRWNGDVSSFGWIGVSSGISNTLVQVARASAATTLASGAAARAVIDFLEEIVVLADGHVLRVEFEGLVVCLARLLEHPFVLVRNRQVVVRRGVLRVDLCGLFPAIQRLFPEALVGDVDAELDLGLCVPMRAAGQRQPRAQREHQNSEGDGLAHLCSQILSTISFRRWRCNLPTPGPPAGRQPRSFFPDAEDSICQGPTPYFSMRTRISLASTCAGGARRLYFRLRSGAGRLFRAADLALLCARPAATLSICRPRRPRHIAKRSAA